MGAASAGVIVAGMAASAATVRQAFRAYGVTVWVGIDEFLRILSEQEKPLVIYYESPAGFMKKKSFWYLTSYKGFVFFTGVYAPLQLPQDIELVITKKLWLPYVLAE